MGPPPSWRHAGRRPAVRRKGLLRGGHPGTFALGFQLEEGAAVVLWHDLDEGAERVVPVFEKGAGAGAAGEQVVTLDQDAQALRVEAQRVAHAVVDDIRGALPRAIETASYVAGPHSLSVITDPRLLLVGVACLLAGWLYTGGPRPYGYLGLGEVFVFLFFGLVATVGTVFVETLRVTPLAILAGCAMGCLATAILVLNNLRDLETDRVAGKRTLAVKLGAAASRAQYAVLVVAPFALALLLGTAWPLLALVAAIPALRTVLKEEGSALNRGLGQTARLQILYSVLLTAGLW